MAVRSQLHLRQFQMASALPASEPGCGVDGIQAAALYPQMAEPPLAGFSEPRSELTCNLSVSRKRAREEPTFLPASSSAIILYQQQRQFLWQKQQAHLLNHIQRKAMQTVIDVPVDNGRIIQSAMTSTSGRPPLADSASAADLSNFSPVFNNNGNSAYGVGSFSSGLISTLNYQNMEVESLLRLQEQKVRSGIEEVRKRQCTALMSYMEQEAQRRVAEKQAELEASSKRNAELEDRLREATAESQTWFNVAKNSEALVAGLRASLEQALLQNLTGGNHNSSCATGVDLSGAVLAVEEGYGDSEEEGGAATAVSCSVWRQDEPSLVVSVTERYVASAAGGCVLRCKSCDEREACVLLLPCRHLCLCASCEHTVNECPICGIQINTTLQISVAA